MQSPAATRRYPQHWPDQRTVLAIILLLYCIWFEVTANGGGVSAETRYSGALIQKSSGLQPVMHDLTIFPVLWRDYTTGFCMQEKKFC